MGCCENTRKVKGELKVIDFFFRIVAQHLETFTALLNR